MILDLKASSYRQWYEALEQYGKSKSLFHRVNYWEKTVQKVMSLLPTDKEYNGDVKPKDLENHIDEDLMLHRRKQLLQEVPRVYHTEINDMLLCALALTLCEKDASRKKL